MIFDLCIHNVIPEWKTVSKLRLQIINILLAKYGYLLFTPANILFERGFLNCIPKITGDKNFTRPLVITSEI